MCIVPTLCVGTQPRTLRVPYGYFDPLDNLVGSGSVYSTVADMALYDAALYTDLLVRQTTLAEAFKPTVLNSGRTVNYGFGWGLGHSHGRRYVGHEGAWLGFISYYVRFLDERLGVIVSVNRDYGLPSADVALKIADIYLTSGCLAGWSGTYSII
ncbi:MAG: class A beta-lactamase-related serine hydrolase [Methylococcaceae bacterium]|nr:MAG: class A beta-lactamase-related serine hydrolase [Methylococcaceae bacterium]